MQKRFRNKYRIASARLAGWDYGWDGAYFVTICTHEMVCILGKVIADESTDEVIVQLSEVGQIADDTWQQIPKHFSFARLGEHVVMPNHLHGIIIIDKPQESEDGTKKSTEAIRWLSDHRVSSPNKHSHGSQPETPGGITGTKNPMLHDNLSRAIRWYKGRTTFECRKILPDFAWHPRFNDHIIRDGDEFEKISNYIINNPRKWHQRRSPI